MCFGVNVERETGDDFWAVVVFFSLVGAHFYYTIEMIVSTLFGLI